MADLWATIAAIEQRPGQTVMIDAMGGVPAWMGGTRIEAAQEDEWVEMMASMVDYGVRVKHLRIDLLGPMNEPDLGDGREGPAVGPDQYVRLLHKLALRLDGLGLGGVKFVAPDTADAGLAGSSYFPAMAGDAVVMAHTAAIGVHRYGAGVGDLDTAIARSAYPRTKFWLTEFSAPCASCDDAAPNPGDWAFASTDVDFLFSYLDQGAAGAMPYDAWDGFYEHHGQVGHWGLLAYDDATKTYTPRKSYYAIQQVMASVPKGSSMVATSSSAGGDVDAHGFHDPAGGRVTVVLRSRGAGSSTVTGRIVGAPGIDSLSARVTNAGDNYAAAGDVAVAADGTFSVRVPGDSIETLTGRPAKGPEQTPPPPPLPAAPTAVITAGPSGSTAETGATFGFSSDDSAATYECVLDSGAWSACASPRSYGGLAVGSHTFSVRATNAAGTGSEATRIWAVSAPFPAPSTSQELLGNAKIEASVDYVDAGQAEAFPATASATGPLQAVRVYLDGDSQAATLVAGVYADAGGHPGARLAQGTLSSPQAGAWNAVAVDGPSLAGATPYWIAVLGTDGALRFRDRLGGAGCVSETSASTSLTALPATWAADREWSTCDVSAVGVS
jgi:hypothetical protein